MSVSSIPEKVKTRLWGIAAGRCQYEGCNERLWLDSMTKAEFNTSYIAHIIADSSDGPRGDTVLSPRLAKEISNLMLMCDKHHRLIDKEDVEGHPVERLQQMKKIHEERVDALCEILEGNQSHIMLYGAKIGEHNSPLSYREACSAMVQEKMYPADTKPIEISLKNSAFQEQDSAYWEIEQTQLRRGVEQKVKSMISSGHISHLSVFALAPQPLLILLGSLLSDIPAAEVYQRRREPMTWKWAGEPTAWNYEVTEPAVPAGDPALVFSLTGTVDEIRVRSILGPDACIWHVTIPDPHNDFLVSRSQALQFRSQMRKLMNRIKAAHGEAATLHVFPVMPVALAVDFGRILMPKADLPLAIYEQDCRTRTFYRALTINARPQTD